MYNLNKKEKLKFILEKSETLGITAYEYGNNTSISTLGASNILTGISKLPRTKQLDIMLDYLEKKLLGSKLNKEEIELFKKENDISDEHFIKICEKLEIKIDSQSKKILNIETDLKNLFNMFLKLQNEIIKNNNRGNTGKKSS